MKEFFLFAGLVLFGVIFLFWNRWQENQKLKKRTREVISPSFLSEIEEERSRDLEKKRQFEKALEEAGRSIQKS